AKEARQKREMLKKASPERPTNFFLARQGKEAGVDRKSNPWPVFVLLLLALAAGAYFWHWHRSTTAPPATSETPTAPPVESSTASTEASSETTSAAPAPTAQAPAPSSQVQWKGEDSGI